ncbi:(Na+)-NQR maturation NqrM [Thiofilum flexile]|uniref:(Na+)-NQR maturation NqrM n=1 Tax=Thiofilum flexile TaxID=125627 RepID=UPI000A002403|nr:(Na+)-NQR maturation NqrM [Thiofilum flexile]
MLTFLVTFIIFTLAVAALSIGWIFSQKSIKGSCGGLSSVPGFEKSSCSCSKPCEKRLKRLAAEASEPSSSTPSSQVINRLID